MKYVVDIETDGIVAQELREVYESFVEYLTAKRSNVFFFDEPAKERVALAQHVEAARLMHNYFCLPEDQIEP
jgi:hypothetical protein